MAAARLPPSTPAGQPVAAHFRFRTDPMTAPAIPIVQRRNSCRLQLSYNHLFGRQVFVGIIDADGDRVLASLDRVGLELEGKLFGVE